MSKLEPNVTTALNFKQLKDLYAEIERIEKAHIQEVGELRSKLYAQVHLKNSIDRVTFEEFGQLFGISGEAVRLWTLPYRKGGHRVQK